MINDVHIAQLIRSLDFVELHLVLSLSLLEIPGITNWIVSHVKSTSQVNMVWHQSVGFCYFIDFPNA